MLGKDSGLCPYCTCKYEMRNTSTIKAIVCLIVVIIAALFLYLLFLMLLEPLLMLKGSKTRDAGLTNSHGGPSLMEPGSAVVGVAGGTEGRGAWNYTQATGPGGRFPHAGPPRASAGGTFEYQSMPQSDQPVGLTQEASAISEESGGVSGVVNRAKNQQKRWKGNVEAQRDRVFTDRTILN